MESLYALTPQELVEKLHLEKPFQGRQIYAWLCKGVTEFALMSDLSKVLRETLTTQYPSAISSKIVNMQQSDSATKLAIELADGAVVECVMLSDGSERKTACLSSQVGCAMGCSFCKTGTMGLVRNLTAAEILEQFVHLRSLDGNITHIVFMGMGEPLANFNPLITAIGFLHAPKGFNISMRRITISTCGLVPGINKLSELKMGVRLAVSLVSADNETRSRIMKVNRAYPLNELKRALLNFQHVTAKRITLEYCMLQGVNTSRQAARDLAHFTDGLDAVINLIPWNSIEGLPYSTPDEKEISSFTRELAAFHLAYTRRISKGRDISGACGQLASESGYILEEDDDEVIPPVIGRRR